jgi:hypothetical protein
MPNTYWNFNSVEGTKIPVTWAHSFRALTVFSSIRLKEMLMPFEFGHDSINFILRDQAQRPQVDFDLVRFAQKNNMSR